MPDSPASKPLDTIIIGAGFAGLAAAKQLCKQGHNNAVVLEARDRVGGRTKHGEIAGIDIDLGGMWLGSTQKRLEALAKEYDVATYPTFLDGKAIFSAAGKIHHGQRENFRGLFGKFELLRYLPAELRLRALIRSIDCEQPWNHKKAKLLDAMSVESWIQKNLASERIKQLYRALCWSLFCAEADQISMLFFVHYAKSGENLDVLASADKTGAQNLLFHGGVHQIARKMADELGSRVRLNEAVLSITHNQTSVIVETQQSSYSAKNIIIAIPPTLVPTIQFDPPLPQAKMALHERLTMGSVIKYWIAYDKPFWREQGFNGTIAGDHSPALPCFDVSPPNQPLGLIAGFFDADDSLEHAASGAAARQKVVTDLLAQHFGEAARNPVDYVDNDWTAEQWSQGCYGAYAAPGVYGRYGEWLRKPIGPLHWAGTETSAQWTGYIDGAIRSGERAAAEVIEKLSS